MKSDSKEGGKSFCSSVALLAYRWIGSEAVRSRLRKLIARLEGGPAFSLTVREILRDFHHVDVGLYTAGPCTMKPGFFHPGTSIGRYSFIAGTVRTFTRNHPMNTKSTHGLFYNSALGKVKAGPLQFNRLIIGNGVRIEHNAIIVPATERIGDGAVITAGSVVCTNVPPYAIASGFPARVVGYRLRQEIIQELLISRWWERSLPELVADNGSFRPSMGGLG